MLAAAPDLSVVDSFDELFGEAIDALRNATAALAGVGAAIGWAEPVRRRLDAQLVVIDGALDELDRILDDAREELL